MSPSPSNSPQLKAASSPSRAEWTCSTEPSSFGPESYIASQFLKKGSDRTAALFLFKCVQGACHEICRIWYVPLRKAGMPSCQEGLTGTLLEPWRGTPGIILSFRHYRRSGPERDYRSLHLIE